MKQQYYKTEIHKNHAGMLVGIYFCCIIFMNTSESLAQREKKQLLLSKDNPIIVSLLRVLQLLLWRCDVLPFFQQLVHVNGFV